MFNFTAVYFLWQKKVFVKKVSQLRTVFPSSKRVVQAFTGCSFLLTILRPLFSNHCHLFNFFTFSFFRFISVECKLFHISPHCSIDSVQYVSEDHHIIEILLFFVVHFRFSILFTLPPHFSGCRTACKNHYYFREFIRWMMS